MSEDAYQILGVSTDASTDEIKAAFRAKAFELHPDSSTSTTANKEQFQKVLEAYEVLRDRGKRATYDALRRAGSTTGFQDSAANDWQWPRGQSSEQAWENAFDEWIRKQGGEFSDFFTSDNESLRQERKNAEIRARKEAWEREKAEAAERKLRSARVKAKAEDARHTRQAQVLRKFWQTKAGATWHDVAILSVFVCTAGWMLAGLVKTNNDDANNDNTRQDTPDSATVST